MTTPSTPWADTLASEAARLLEDMRAVAPEITQALVRYVQAEAMVLSGIGAFAVLMGFVWLIYALFFLPARMKSWSSIDSGSVSFLNLFIAGVVIFVGLITIGTNLPAAIAPEGATVLKALAALRGAPQ